MVRRVLGFVLALVTAAAALSAAPPDPRPHWQSEDGYDWWTDCNEVPDPIEFLPIYLGTEPPGFVDLGRSIVRSDVRWRALQYTRDKDLGATRVSTGRWYGGMGADHWPPQSVDVRRQLDRFRILAWDVDGNRHAVPASCVIALDTDDLTIGFYNAWVRFTEPGLHTVKITGRQLDDFYFIDPFAQSGLADPFGLEGRRVLLRGEFVGETLDGDFTHTYELHVGREAEARRP